MKTILIVAGIAVLVLTGGSLWSKSLAASDPNILATTGIHWHPQLRIFVKDQEIAIPHNLGLGVTESPIHTHEDLPLIHLEFQGVVRAQDVTLGQFFKVWGKDIRSFGANMRMSVNGVPNTAYENYVMHDGDKIELHYD